MAGIWDSLSSFADNNKSGLELAGNIASGAGNIYGVIDAHNQAKQNRQLQAQQAAANLAQQRELSLKSGQQYGSRGSRQSYENTLWAPQELALRNQFSMANENMKRGAFAGDRYATWTPYQQRTFGDAVDYYNYQAPQNANFLTSTGQGMIGNYGTAENTYNAIAQNGGVDPDAINGVMQSQQPFVNQQINSATNAINRNAGRQMAQMRENLAAGGGLSGTRGAVQQALINEGANNAIADATTQINSNAFNTALTQANQDVTNRMSAANNLASLANRGAGLYTQGTTMQGDILNSRANIGSASQANDQNIINNEYARWSSPWDLNAKYAALVGGRQWGGGRTQNSFQSNYSATNSQPYGKDGQAPAQTFNGVVMPWQAAGMQGVQPAPTQPVLAAR